MNFSTVTVAFTVLMVGCVAHSAYKSTPPEVTAASVQSSESSLARQQAGSLFFLSERLGWVASNGTVYCTRDGGDHWQRVYAGSVTDTIAVFFINENEGWMTVNQTSGDHAHLVLQTRDGGAHWRQVLNVDSPILS